MNHIIAADCALYVFMREENWMDSLEGGDVWHWVQNDHHCGGVHRDTADECKSRMGFEKGARRDVRPSCFKSKRIHSIG
jgi:hypothetical protein